MAAAGPYAAHEGFMIGFGFGFAAATCDDCETQTAFGFDFSIGGFVNPQVALMYDVGGWLDSENGATLLLATNTFACQYWVAPNVWIKGGIGLSQARVAFDGDSDSEFGLGLAAAAGVEVMQNGGFALDLSGRLSALDFDNGSIQTFSLVLGARWK